MDNNNPENAPKATISMFGDQYNYCETYAPDSEELTAYEANWKRAGHKTARKKNKQNPEQIDLYVKQQKG